MSLLRRLDRDMARLEGAVVVFVLLAMVAVASLQALFFNIAQNNVAWAHAALESISWADMFLQKGTLWLAFVGASLAAHDEKHIAIDVLAKIAPPSVARVMRAFAGLGAGIIALLLGWVFFDACVVADAAVPFEYEILTDQGPQHVCDAPGQAGDTDVPQVLCGMRAALQAVGVSVTSGGGVAQLIAPLMFIVIGLRLLARGVSLVVYGEVPPPETIATRVEDSDPVVASEAEPPAQGADDDEATAEPRTVAEDSPEPRGSDTQDTTEVPRSDTPQDSSAKSDSDESRKP